jgi:hypothetical protein
MAKCFISNKHMYIFRSYTIVEGGGRGEGTLPWRWKCFKCLLFIRITSKTDKTAQWNWESICKLNFWITNKNCTRVCTCVNDENRKAVVDAEAHCVHVFCTRRDNGASGHPILREKLPKGLRTHITPNVAFVRTGFWLLFRRSRKPRLKCQLTTLVF